MNALDAGMFFAENDTTPLQIGTVAVFEGPAPDYPDLVRQVFARLRLAPRCLQRVRTVPFNLAHPVWVDDQRFAIGDHVRHAAAPEPGGPDELSELAGRILAPPLDLSRSPWEVWLVDGLADGRWAMICKVHHCMVDGLAGIDLMAVLLDTGPAWTPAPPRVWMPEPEPAAMAVVRDGVVDRLRGFGRQATRLFLPVLRDSISVAGAVPGYATRLTGSGTSSLNGPTGPHRRWSRLHAGMDEVDRIRRTFGGSVNDVVLAAAARGFRDLLEARGVLTEESIVRAMVPVSVRSEDERGVPSNRVSAVPVDLPCGEADPLRRLRLIRQQMDSVKSGNQAAGLDAFVRLAGGAPGLLAAAAHTALRLRQPLIHTIVTNVPGPAVPLYSMGRRMLEIGPYIPIAAGLRISIGIVSYNGALSFGLTGDRDAVPDLETLCAGIRDGIDELLKEAAQAAPGAL
ncbi:wax ester/triacylglycerol synthase family O-acyltransferase [Spirillospora sp. NPDC048824]|uniref:wax ester/triacylglycerol synthase family O-acyltransferase n=1 Tax=Spirillospora sp. NPDC048824 TaxID=3364526 RepID=UPI0037200CF6